jgi:hypothetical protein
MVRFFALILLLGTIPALRAQNPSETANPGQSKLPTSANPSSTPSTQPASAPDASDTEPTGVLPPSPKGKSTILGGEIRFVDPVRDQLLLKAYGQKPIKIFFDERTQVFKDGKRIPLLTLKTTDHASIQTTLDGTNIFALSIHILSRAPQGDYEGKVEIYDPGTTELTLNSVISRQPLKLLVPRDTPITREGQTAFAAQHPGAADLVHGALLSLKFESDNKGHGVATQISVLAVPGADFVFSGSITTLDVAAGHLVVTDPRDDRTYDITFDSRIQSNQNLHQGDHVMVKATFDGNSYVARSISVQ